MTAPRRIVLRTALRARSGRIIVKYFVSPERVIFHGRIQFYVVLVPFVPARFLRTDRMEYSSRPRAAVISIPHNSRR
jgi:hypothetical protein